MEATLQALYATQMKQTSRYEKLSCAESLFVFTKDNMVRKLYLINSSCFRVVSHKIFDNLIISVIIISSLNLVVDTYQTLSFQQDLDYIVNAIFISELSFKVILYGLYVSQDSYLRDPWNQLDCIIVCFSIIDMALVNYNLSFLKVTP